MTASVLLEMIKAKIETDFRADYQTVDYYGGEFASEEIAQLSFNAPAALVACLGWHRMDKAERAAGNGPILARMAVFIACKHAKRNERMLAALNRAERLTVGLRRWVPQSPVASFGGVEELKCENLYSRATDKQGIALWMVSWWQEAATPMTAPELPDLLIVDIDSQARVELDQTPEPAPAPDAATLETIHNLEIHRNA